ncbi:MAG: phage portal protein, partial [Cellulomonas sp.]|nr:phage portal protein [Cellulomonas sp.]
MALWDSVRRLLGRGTQFEGTVTLGPSAASPILHMPVSELYETQPHLRTIVSFLARNIAQLPLQGFARTADDDRRRVRDDPLIRALARPNPAVTAYELKFALIGSLKLYDVGIWAIVPDPDLGGEWQIWPIPVSWVVRTGGGTAWEPAWMEVARPKDGGPFGAQRGSWPGRPVRLENKPGERQFLLFHGWNPLDPATGSSPVESLRQILAEQIQAWQYREQVWQRGGRVGTMIVRPVEAPPWSDEARTKFGRDWSAKWTGPDGAKAGGTPILEDGMKLERIGFSAHEEEWAEAARLSLSTCAGVYHTSPSMVGATDGSSYASEREFSRRLYTDTLGPDLAAVESRINHFLVPEMSTTPDLYIEFNLAEKLQGSFEEQAAVISTSVGRPWMTADEARARFNLPAIGGDAAALVTPLNVLVGGQASPRDTGSQNRSTAPAPPAKAATREAADAPLLVKSEADEQDEAAARQVLVKFFRRQRATVLSAIGAKADDPDWWDGERW